MVEVEDVGEPAKPRQRLTTIFGWLAGGAAGLLVNFGLAALVGEGYPITITTFVTFIAGAFGGMRVADKLGPEGFRPLGIAAGILFAVIVGMVLVAFLAPPS